MRSGNQFLAVDWGTTNRRVYRIEDGRAVGTDRDGCGVAAIGPDGFEAEATAIRAKQGDLPMLLAGMVGSNIGWRKVPYVAAPVSLADLAASVERIDGRTAIIPGVSVSEESHVDVMRGEEVQILGAAAAGLIPDDGFLCQPGTHCKWVDLKGGAITGFTTTMTGELFALLSTHGLLAKQLAGDVAVGPAFLEGVAEGARRDLPASLFSVRARAMLGRIEHEDASSYASGILIGADVAPRIDPGAAIYLLADEKLGDLYSAAIQALGGVAYRVDSEAAFVAGASEIWSLADVR